MDRRQALELLEAARQGTWAGAVRARYPEGHNMRFGLLDTQRASWAPMLGLDERSVALDIGSGYGAITHSLSRFAGEVYSVEAVPERIDFTRERLLQERILNVHLVQASATGLPFAENSFDLVVVNGVLEWIGEWDLEVDPRTSQLNFLRKICRLLKDDGVLAVGIENRFGVGQLLGQNDHSGIPYTGLVPRRMASFMLRHSSKPHHRTQLNARKEYRTYTYSERGYRKLLSDAGFEDMLSYWADPGYNQPYHLIPLAITDWVNQHHVELLHHPGPAPRRSWRRRLKNIALPVVPWILPDFLLLASKQPGRKSKLQTWIGERLAESNGNSADFATSPRSATWALHTGPFKSKSVVRLGDAKTGHDVAYLKIFTRDRNLGTGFDTEMVNRAKVQDSLAVSTSRSIRVPQSYGTLQIGSTAYCLESASHGTHLSVMVRELGYFEDQKRVERDFTQICDGIVELTSALQQVSEVPAINPTWREIPEQLKAQPGLADSLEKKRYFRDTSGATSALIQHSDLSVENTFIDRKSGQLEVCDWDDLASGLPPLYDFFQFFYSTGYLPRSKEIVRFASEEDRWIATFNAVFLSDAGFGLLTRRLMGHVCKELNISPKDLPSLLLEFLVIRCHYCQARSAVQHRVQLRLLEQCVEVFERLHLG
jgi:SAM-dependent methyltransferase